MSAPSTSRVRRIRKEPAAAALAPNLLDYERARESFTWDAARAALDGLPGGRGLNIAHEAVDRHAAGGRGERVRAALAAAARARRATSPTPTWRGEPNRFANVLAELGVRARRARVRLLRPGPRALRRGARHAEARRRLLPAVLGLRAGADPPAAGARRRARSSSPPPRCTRARSRRMRGELPDLRARAARRRRRRRRRSTARATSTPLLAAQDADVSRSRRPTPRTRRCCTSRAARPGTPKGAVHVHEAVVAHHVTGALRARPASRRRLLVHRRPGLGDRHVLRDHRAAHPRRDQHRRRGATSTPSAGTRILERAAGHRLVHGADRDPHADARRAPSSRAQHDLPRLRFIASVGEPLNPEAVRVGRARRSACRSTTTGGRPRPAGS